MSTRSNFTGRFGGARREFMYKAVHSDWAATKDAAATPSGLIPDPTKFVIEDTFD